MNEKMDSLHTVQENVCLFSINCVSDLPLAHCSEILVSLPNTTVLSVV